MTPHWTIIDKTISPVTEMVCLKSQNMYVIHVTPWKQNSNLSSQILLVTNYQFTRFDSDDVAGSHACHTYYPLKTEAISKLCFSDWESQNQEPWTIMCLTIKITLNYPISKEPWCWEDVQYSSSRCDKLQEKKKRSILRYMRNKS